MEMEANVDLGCPQH